MGYMVPLIRARGGYVNKFLGDGIMFFYGAPWPSQQHAAEAVQTVLDMHDAMGQFNRELTEQGLPNVHMRAGIASGPMVVGDAGPPEASDYTALGDTVNLAARLEPANKSTGTQTIITERTRQLLGGMLLTRPLGSLQVVGKTEGVMVHEPMAYTDRGTDRQHRLCEQTRHMVELYQSARFAACEEAADQLDETFGPSKLTELYRQTCRQYLTDPPVEFAGHLVLTEK
jgi:adenylate cyclase